MAESENLKKPNGAEAAEKKETNQENLRMEEIDGMGNHKEKTLYSVLHHLFTSIFFPDPNSSSASTSLIQRIKTSVNDNGALLREASRNSSRNLLLWTRQGSPLRALLVISWICRFLFCTSSGQMTKEYSQIAIALAFGRQLALAPAVLNQLYRDKTLPISIRSMIEPDLTEDPDGSSNPPIKKLVKPSKTAKVVDSKQALFEMKRRSTRQSSFQTVGAGTFVVVGTIILLALTGLLIFMLFFLAATINAVVISLLMSLSAAGGFLVLFFACVTAIYIGVLATAMFVISTATISIIIAAIIATGWIGFFLVLWFVANKSIGLARHSLSITGSALSSYTSAQRAHHREPDKISD
ncbi:hypothetical protein HHK36_024189 [Tetracentron sinense]|uniref:Aminotransferase-like plant mobile domain-containing protein n=1 Tax=Tetracentron sinense TaxID=13715 RepID=A0A834YMT6_TETSI|nr:hypothetical protein HHK36_024189 [Tetracentron sinense]